MNYSKDFASLKKVTYFDNAATTQKPKQVIEAMNQYYEGYCANIHRGVYDWSLKASDEYESARETVAKFINAKPKEIIFVRNTTEGLNLISNVLNKKIKSGDTLTSISEHHSNYLPWRENAVGRVKTIGVDKDYKHDLKELEKNIDKKTKIVALNHVSNVLGIKNDISKISKIVHDNESYFVVDAAQSVPHTKIDVKKSNLDAIAFSGHKLLGPTGIGVLYVKAELLKELGVYQVGGGTIVDVSTNNVKYATYPSRYEAGTPDIAGAIGLKAAICYLNKIGLNNIEKHEIELSKLLVNGLNNLGANIIGNTTKDKLGVVSFNFENYNPNDLAMQLSMQNIYLRSGHHCAIPLHKYFKVEHSLRASVYFYNTKEEVKRFLEALEKIVR